MADDLIIKFFREDLTEAEESTLSDHLSSSIEDALRFGQHAEASYRHYGLPEPAWRGGPPPGFYPKSGLKFGLWLPIAFLAGLSALGAWKYWTRTESKPSTSIPTGVSTVLAHTPQKRTESSPVVSEDKVIPDRLTREEVTAKTSSPDAAAVNSPAASTQPAMPPINAALQPHHPHSNLEVLVKRAKPGEVTVRVLEPNGNQAVLLYQGLLQPGSWAFDWNGRLSDGGRPPAGTYQIQVVSGAVTLSKPVVIRK